MKITNQWTCQTCELKPTFDYTELRKHLEEVHNIKAKGIGDYGLSKFLMHTDYEKWFTYLYEWDIQGIILHQFIKQPRSKASQKIWADYGRTES